MNAAPAAVSPAPVPPAAPAVDSAALVAFDQQFRVVADMVNAAYMQLLAYAGKNQDFGQHFVVIPAIHLKAGAGYNGVVMNDNGLDPATIKTIDDLKPWLAQCVVASPNLPDQLLTPGVIALRDRAVESALETVKAMQANKTPPVDQGAWVARTGTRAQTPTGIAG